MATTVAPPLERLLNRDALAAVLSLSKASIDRMNASGRLPRPLHLSRGAIRWRQSDISAWLAANCPERTVFEKLQAGTDRR